jgi:hypothetical protein
MPLNSSSDAGAGERVDLLEDPGDRREVGGLDLGQLRHDRLGVAAEVGDRPAAVERQQLDEQRVGVRERQEQVRGVAVAFEHADALAHVENAAIVAVREHAALRRPRRA